MSATGLFRFFGCRLKHRPIGIGQVSHNVQNYSLRYDAFFNLHDVILSYVDEYTDSLA
jgi:uncharacterized membrane protein